MSAGVRPGSVVAVVGEGAVGLSGVIVSERLGAERSIALSRSPARQDLARSFGATDDGWRRRSLSHEPARTSGSSASPTASRSPSAPCSPATVGLRGGVAPVRRYMPDLLDDVLEGRINPGRVFDFETGLDGIAGAYADMDERRAIKS